MKVLQGVRVVEQGAFITGPCAAMLLADLGADVIKVEPPGVGDPYRRFGEGLYSPHFQAYNRNKRSLVLDAKADRDQARLQALIASADVYIQNFRPGAESRIGMDATTLQGANPRLVYCAITGFGADGPYVARPSYDSVAQALSGFLGVAIDPDAPRLLGPALADAITGLYAALGIMGALVERGRTGRGRRVEVSMLEAMMHFAVEPFTGFFSLGTTPTSQDRPRLAQAYLLRCRDDLLIAVHLSSLEKFWENMVEALEAPELAQDQRFATRLARIENYTVLAEALNARTATHDRADWLRRMAGFDLPYAPVNSVVEAVDDPQVRALGIVAPVKGRREGARRAIRPPFGFDGWRATAVRAAPLLDQDGDAIRTRLDAGTSVWLEA